MGNDVDIDVLRSIFKSRCQLAKKTPEEVTEDALRELDMALAWIKSNTTREGSFLWMCDEFDLEPSAVRRAIQEKRK
jgi:hypothetical protein